MYASERGAERALAAIEENARTAGEREQRNYGPVF
jgi:hypothetical protein